MRALPVAEATPFKPIVKKSDERLFG